MMLLEMVDKMEMKDESGWASEDPSVLMRIYQISDCIATIDLHLARAVADIARGRCLVARQHWGACADYFAYHSSATT